MEELVSGGEVDAGIANNMAKERIAIDEEPFGSSVVANKVETKWKELLKPIGNIRLRGRVGHYGKMIEQV